MPARKSDASAHRSNVTMAKFELAKDETPRPGSSAQEQETPMDMDQPTEPPSATAATPATPSVTTEKDKDKDKEKEKERAERRESGAVTIEDLGLPKSIITRLAKGVLPSNTQIQANAVLAISKSATVFINHLANAANEHTMEANKKTIMPQDVFDALEDIEFPFFKERLEAEFKKFNETQTNKRNNYRKKVAAKKTGGPEDANDPNASMISSATVEGDSTPRSKKQKPNEADDSQMDVDGDPTEEFHDASDGPSEPEQDDDDEEDEDDGNEEDSDDADGPGGEGDTQDNLEEKEADEEKDEALDDGDESD